MKLALVGAAALVVNAAACLGEERAIQPAAGTAPPAAAATPAFRAPAVPLVAHNPYFSAWSRSDRLTDGWPQHWTGGNNAMCGMVRIDGKPMRFLGHTPGANTPALNQTGMDWTATSSTYTFEGGGVKVSVRFLSPVLSDDADLASRTVSFVTVSAAATDGQSHEVAAYLDATAEWCVHDSGQEVTWSRARLSMDGRKESALELARMGTSDQPALRRTGDYTRIDWGWMYLGVPAGERTAVRVSPHTASRGAFLQTGRLPEGDDLRLPRAASDNWPVMAATIDLGKVGKDGASGTFFLGYDDTTCLEYFGRQVRPYWARSGMDFATMFGEQVRDHAKLVERCAAFDRGLLERLRAVGSERYARLCELLYRQVMAAHQIAADFDGTMLMFPKENSSNGCLGTVDVIFPTAPFLLALNPQLEKANLLPVMDYASSPRWKFPFAPHDLGVWPKCNGQVYGGGERTEENQMPVEECGNMLVLLGAISNIDGNAAFASKWWPTVTTWAGYLRDHGLDPENQLCTDDFAGHLARNANLSVKAIVGIGAYAKMCEMRGEKEESAKWMAIARDYSAKWRGLAKDGDATDHTVLAFGKPGTWSLKYNMVWDDVLGLGLFPPELKKSEVKFYRSKLNRFGTPMDSRENYTKPEWITWAACLSGEREDFDALVDPIAGFAGATPDRVPFCDWYTTTDGRNKGMFARSVGGGMYVPLLRRGSK